jgi:hypothetical protein
MPIIPVCDSSRFHVEGDASGPECRDASLRRYLCVCVCVWNARGAAVQGVPKVAHLVVRSWCDAASLRKWSRLFEEMEEMQLLFCP